VFQVHGVDAAGQVVIRRKLKRRYVLAFFQKLPPCLVGIEALRMHFDRLKRREFITLIGGAALASPRPAIGQSLASQYTIGVLWPAISPPAPPRMESFRQALRQLDFVEGRNVVIELRHPRAGPQELPDLAAELVRLKVDVITAFGDHAPRVVQQATQTIPIVAISDDMFGAGASLFRWSVVLRQRGRSRRGRNNPSRCDALPS